MKRPLSAVLVSILDTSMRNEVTHVEISRRANTVDLRRGATSIGSGPLPAGAFEALVEELCALGAKRGGVAPIVVHSPVGPIPFTVTIEEARIAFVLRDEEEAARDAAFAELMKHARSVGAQTIVCGAGKARFEKDGRVLETAPLAKDALARLVEHGRGLADLGDDRRSGSAVLFNSSGERAVLEIALVDDGVSFTMR